MDFYNTGSISVGGSIGNGNTTQNGGSSSTGGSIGFSANVTLPSSPTAPTMPGLMELSTTTNNHITENTHNIYNNTNNQTNIEKILNEWKLTQNGDRVSGNIYDFQNHANQGDETFGLMELEDYHFNPVMSHVTYDTYGCGGDAICGSAGHVSIFGDRNTASSGSNPNHLMELEDFLFNPVLSDNAKLESGEILTGDAGHVAISGDRNTFIQGTSHATANSNSVPNHLMELEDFLFNPVMSDNAKLESGEILTGDAGHVSISGDRNTFIQGTSKATSNSNSVPNHLVMLL